MSRGALRVASGRIALGRGGTFVVKTPDAGMTLRGADLDITYIVAKPGTASEVQVGTYARSYSGAAVLSNASGEVTLRDGQIAYAKLRAAPRVLSSNPYFYYWHGYIDRRAAAVAEKLEMLVP